MIIICNTSHTTIDKYERDEMVPSIDAAKKLAEILDTSVGYLLRENDEANLFISHNKGLIIKCYFLLKTMFSSVIISF